MAFTRAFADMQVVFHLLPPLDNKGWQSPISIFIVPVMPMDIIFADLRILRCIED